MKMRRRVSLFGWMLFIVSASFFMAASWRAGDAIGLIGGAFFLAGCLVFVALPPRGEG